VLIFQRSEKGWQKSRQLTWKSQGKYRSGTRKELIIQEMKNRGASTIDELANFTRMEKTKLFRHLVAMRQFGKVSIVGERDGQLVYGLP
jgi:predicted transcriptional regulator